MNRDLRAREMYINLDGWAPADHLRLFRLVNAVESLRDCGLAISAGMQPVGAA